MCHHLGVILLRQCIWFCAGKEAAEAREAGEGDAGEAEAAAQAVLSGKVAEIVFRNAVDALPCTVAVRRRFLDALQPFSFPGIASIAQASYSIALALCAGDKRGRDALQWRFGCIGGSDYCKAVGCL